jgi:hypothetical protein
MRRNLLAFALLLAIGSGLGIAGYVYSQQAVDTGTRGTPVRLEPAAIAFRVMLGRGDKAVTDWSGSVAVSGGTLIGLEGWRFRKGDSVNPPASWTASTLGGKRQAILPVGVVVTLNATPQADVTVTTPQGAFDFHPTEITSDRPGIFLNGAAGVVRVAADFHLASAPGPVMSAAPTENDFPAAAEAKDGTLWVAYVAYRYGTGDAPILGNYKQQPANFDSLVPKGNGDQVRLARISEDGTTFTDVAAVTAPGQDVMRPAIAVDNDGDVWIVWSQNVKGNWDLYTRHYHNGDPSPVERLTTDVGPDLAPALARDDRGTLWLAWQGFRDGQSDIFLRSRPNGGDRWSDRITVSDSPKNDWDPAIACAHDGSVYVVWDTYDKGDYDVRMRRIVNGKPEPVIPVADTPFFEARASVVCDAQNRAWVAYEQGSQEWGKDYGYVVENQGSPLYQNHTVDVRCFVDGKPYHTVGPVAASFQAGARPRVRPGARRRQPQAGLSEVGQQPQVASDDEDSPQAGLVTASLQAGQQRRPRPGGARAAGRRPGQAAPDQSQPGSDQEARPVARVQNVQRSFPRLGTDKSGRVYLTFRQTFADLRVPIGSTWLSCVTTYDGDAWTPAQIVPDSDAVLDNRPAIVPASNGQVALIHASDGRSHAFGTTPRYDLYLALVSLETGSAAPQLVADDPTPPHSVSPKTTAEREAVERVRDYRAKIGGVTYQLVRGDYHRHTEISFDGGGDGSLSDMFRYAIDAASQDWICAGDHDYGTGREYTWWQIQKHDDAYHTGPQFVPIFGYERSLNYPNGHRNLMFVQRGIRNLPRLVTGGGISPNDTKMLYRFLRQFNAICASHTSATNMGTDWRDNDPDLEPVVEIYQGDRQNYEYEGAPRSGNATNSQGGFQPAGFVWNAFAKGYKFGFEASSDHHSTHISY